MSERYPPSHIYLQWFGEDTAEANYAAVPADAEICWCDDKIFDSDIEYVLSAKSRKRIERAKKRATPAEPEKER
jgi:hypothetical protein